MARILYTVREAAHLLGLGETKTRELVLSGQIKSVMIGRLRRIPYDDLMEFVESLKA